MSNFAVPRVSSSISALPPLIVAVKDLAANHRNSSLEIKLELPSRSLLALHFFSGHLLYERHEVGTGRSVIGGVEKLVLLNTH